MRRRSTVLAITAIALTCPVLLLLSGCKRVDQLKAESEAWRKQAQELEKRLAGFEAQWSNTNKALVEAADSIDPFALKELMRKNQSLEAALRDLQDISKLRADGYLRAEAGTIYLKVVDFNGKFRVDAEILGIDVRPWSGVVLDASEAVRIRRGTALDVDYASWLRGFCSQHYQNPDLNKCAGNLQGAAYAYMTEVVLPAFARLVDGAARTDEHYERFKTNISDQTDGVGPRKIQLRITPLDAPSRGDWSVKIHVIQERKDGTTQILRTIQRSRATEEFVPGQPLSPEEIRLNIAGGTRP